jgi:exodeoxyribonuclease VII large subunit
MGYELSDHIFSVSEFLDLINAAIGQAPAIVQGEITGAHEHQTGVYFSLKDASVSTGSTAIMDCYMSPLVYRGLGIKIEDGMQAKVGGVPSVYKPKGRFSFRVETLELAGEGSLKKAYELLKKQLESEGLFLRKRQLPEFIQRIGIITSRTGAVIDDFRKNVLQIGLALHLYDVRVEGARAVDQIVAAVQWFNAHMPELDVIAIMRGGGSLEDLQAFNNEHVARAIFASDIPTICAIGHDRDVPIAALIGDTATSTPTAAAVLVNQSWDRLAFALPAAGQKIVHGFERVLDDAYHGIDAEPMVRVYAQTLDALATRLHAYDVYLDGVNPERNLARGYSIVTNREGSVVKSAEQLHEHDPLKIQFFHGAVESRVEKVVS